MKRNLLATTFFSAFLCFTGSAAALCPLSQTNPSVTVCTPTQNALVQTMVHVVAGSTDSNPVTSMQVYVDGIKQLEYFNVNRLPAGAQAKLHGSGVHRITVQTYDQTKSAWVKSIVYVMNP